MNRIRRRNLKLARSAPIFGRCRPRRRSVENSAAAPLQHQLRLRRSWSDRIMRRRMSFYEKQILPRLLDLSMRQERLAAYRRQVTSVASGTVLEIGIGSGLNL